MSAVQFAYRKGLGCTDALLTISYYLQKSFDAGMESYVVQFDFSEAFDRVSHSGLLFKYKSICVGGCVLSICTEFLSVCRHRVVGDGPTSEWIPIVSCVPLESVLDPLLFILYTSEMFELVTLHYAVCNAYVMPMLITLHYWQLFASQQTDLLLLPPLTGA